MKKQMFKVFLVLLFLIQSGCNMWSGLGRDVQEVGRKIEDQGSRNR
jgi:predicted small secreted protein